ncbi:type VI secretion system membrane subunit TssM [Caballeronia concitans]|uniref:Putative lipoprotein n=1 Tax=Caballeronia concitans TaxID=1777133 RepID=A0A658R3J3_9BURK|nr:type VI secretion system membrane subunit TssM [Caballeronia concitans]KIG01709.1 type VI secretion protein IcmF [Burkholderia sp. MR1]SAL46800.1 putative lipoprotein [Caballeronia concitans]
MKKVAETLRMPKWFTLAGVLALLVVVWFEGPLFAFNGHAPLETPRSRWIAMAALVAMWGIVWGARLIAARLVNLRFTSGMSGQGQTAAAGSAELAILRERFEQALAILRQARMKGVNGRQWVYQLPWYMFIGAPGTGKSTALAHSGLRFPLRDKLGDEAIGGVGGTRHCDWWFTDDAVLVDTAGRFTTQDSDAQADESAWTGFLQLLRKYRPRRPLNGVIVTLSAADLVHDDEAARDAHIRTIRSRLTELSERLGVRFPVYVVVTKCDLLAGFTEFFDDLGEAERNQVWGITFALDESPGAGAALGAFPAEFDALGTRLQARVLHRMQRETDVARRARIYGFAQQFAGLQPALERFLDGAFRGTRFEASPLLRGVYFTSGTQHGRPIDRAISRIAQSLGLRRDAAYNRDASGRAYFINRMLKDVVIAEAGLVGANARFERCSAWLRRGALAFVGVTLMLALACMAVSYQRNRAYVAAFERETQHVAQLAREANATADPLAVLPLLDAARALPGGYADAARPVPWLTRLWLYQGDKLGQEARVTYRRLLDQTLLPLAVGKLTQELRDGGSNNASASEAYRYEALRAYLMLGDARHFEAAALRTHLVPALAGNATPAQRSALDAHLAALFDKTHFDPSLPLDDALVKAARARLAQLPLSQRIGNRVDGELTQANVPAFSVSAAAGPNAPLLLRRTSGAPLTAGVAGAYTRAGYAQYTRLRDAALTSVAKDAWVLGSDDAALTPDGVASLRAALDERYFDAYTRAWDALLDDVTAAPVTGLADGARIANELSAPDSPLRKFIVAAARETTLAGNATTRVDDHFQPLHQLAGKPGDATALDRALAPLKDAAVYLDAADAARRMGQPAPAGDALGKLRLASQTSPAPLTPVAASIVTAGTALVEGGERARLDAQWNANAGPLCRRALDGRYPFVRASTRDVAADDFGKLFAPGGLIDDFFQKNLAALADTSGPVWQWRAGTPPAGTPRDALAQFQRAAQIRDAFFHDGSRDMSIRFRVKALSLDPAITHVNLDIDGQQLALTQDGLQSMLLQWPSGKNTGRASAQFDPASPAQSASFDASGPWALLHLIDAGRLDATAQPDRYRLTLDSAGRKAVLELDATSVVNPFRRAPLEQFRCPEHL